MYFIYLCLIGLLAGVLSCFIGGGAEIIIVPLLIYFGIFDNYKEAVGTSLASLLMPIGLFAVIAYMKEKCSDTGRSCVNWFYAFIISITFTIGTLLAFFTSHIDMYYFKKLFYIIVTIMGITGMFIY